MYDDFHLPVSLGQTMDTNDKGKKYLTDKTLFLDPSLFDTHFHFIGATGSGKTTAMETILYSLIMDESPGRSFFIVDPLGPFAHRMMRFLANPDYCSDAVRERVVYFEPADERYVTTLHPLRYESRAHLDYQVSRAMDLILRGFETQAIDMMPRLRLWLYRSLFDLSCTGYPLAIAKYLLNPRLEEHPLLVAQLPADQRAEWTFLLKDARGEAARILESTRNRMSLFSDYVILERMFGSTANRFDVPRFMEEGKIVIVNLTHGEQRLNEHGAATIGSLIINEVLNHGMTQFHKHKRPTDTFLCIDEFQRFLGPDIYHFLPVIRNMGIHLMLAHQSFSQLEKGEIDLRPMIAQARSRLMFANDFEDANILAEEIASLKWDPDKIKREYESFRQRIVGHEIKILRGGGSTDTNTRSETDQRAGSHGTSQPDKVGSPKTHSNQLSNAHVEGTSLSKAETINWHEQLVPIHEDFYETVRVEYESLEECEHRWRQRVRGQGKGEALVKLAEDPELYHVQVDYLPQDTDDPRIDDLVEELKEQNYQNEPFVTAEAADRELESQRQRLLQGPRLDAGSSDDDQGADGVRQLMP